MALRAGLVMCALLAAMPAFADENAPTEEAAAWTRHEVDFQYMGFTTRYTCSGLKSKVRLLLKHMGVREDIKILERGCEFGYQKVADFPRLKIPSYHPRLEAGRPRRPANRPRRHGTGRIKKNSPRAG